MNKPKETELVCRVARCSALYSSRKALNNYDMRLIHREITRDIIDSFCRTTGTDTDFYFIAVRNKFRNMKKNGSVFLITERTINNFCRQIFFHEK